MIFSELALFDRVVHLSDTVDQAVKKGLFDPAEIEKWMADLQGRDREGLFFSAMTGLITSGLKPYKVGDRSSHL